MIYIYFLFGIKVLEFEMLNMFVRKIINKYKFKY